MLFFCTKDYHYYGDWPTNGEWLDQCNRTFGFSFLISKDRWDMTYHFLFVCMDIDHLYSDWPNFEYWPMQTAGSFGFKNCLKSVKLARFFQRKLSLRAKWNHGTYELKQILL